MRRSVVVVLAVLAILGLLAPPSFAQAPAPKVTINGLVDFVTTAYKNWSQTGQQAGAGVGQPDPSNSKERGWYSRERGVFTLTGEIGKVKGVWAIELDFTNGAGNFNNASAPGSLTTVGVASSGTSANFDLDTDVQGAVETKWLYLEAPITGPGSLLPFIPVSTIGRMGGQPFRGHDYKFGVLASGDFPGVALETAWTPNVRSTLTFVQIGEQLDSFAAPNQKDDWAILASLEADVFKGLTIKPTFAHAEYDGGNCGTANLGTPAFGGYNPNTNCPGVVAGTVAGPGNPGQRITRNYMGADVRWTTGPWSFQPTFMYLLGSEDVRNRSGVNNDVSINSFLVDVIGGFRTGPLNLQMRVMYTPGQGANNDIQNAGGGTDRTYHAINPGFAYMTGWTEIWTGGIDYSTGFLVGRSGLTLRESPSYDKYGRLFVALAADYALTPALTLSLTTNVSWTDTKVDTKGVYGAGINASGITTAGNPFNGGKENYLGNEWVAGMTYRFAPNMAFDLVGAALITGDALNITRTVGGPIQEAKDVFKGSARFRVTF
jgi:hypothetical protein